jgi:hypothetical protein
VNNESRPKAAPADSRSEVKSQFSGGARRAYDETRYAAVSVAVLQLLPESNARALAVAFALGISLDSAGSSDSVRNGRQVSGCLIRRDRLPDVLEALGNPDPSQWRRYVRDWVRRGIAHRCRPGVVCLFRLPLLLECPSCHADLAGSIDRAPSRAKRGPRREQRSRAYGSNAPVRREFRSRDGGVSLPPSSTEVPHRNPGINGMEVGRSMPEPSVEAVDLPAVATQGGISEAAATPFKWRPSPFADKRCPECRCWPHQGDHFAGCSRRTVRDVSA